MIVIVLVVLCIPELYTGGIEISHDAQVLSPPNADYWFGTDRLGRDLFARSIHAARRSLLLASSAELLVLLVGTVIGAAAGYFRRPLILILADAMGAVALSLPFLLLAMVAATVLSALGLPLIVAVAGVGWVYTMRIVRGEVMAMRSSTPVLAALAWGLPTPRILLRIVLPRLLHLLPSVALFGVAEIIGIEAGLSFLGIGVIGSTPSLGGMLLEARPLASSFWWLAVGPCSVLVALVVACNFLADGWGQDA